MIERLWTGQGNSWKVGETVGSVEFILVNTLRLVLSGTVAPSVGELNQYL